MTLSVNWRGDGRRVVALTAVAMSERNEAEQHETGQQPKPPILTRGMIMEFVWDAGCNYPIAIHVTEEGLYPSLQSLADHEDLPVRYLPTNEDFYPQ